MIDLQMTPTSFAEVFSEAPSFRQDFEIGNYLEIEIFTGCDKGMFILYISKNPLNFKYTLYALKQVECPDDDFYNSVKGNSSIDGFRGFFIKPSYSKYVERWGIPFRALEVVTGHNSCNTEEQGMKWLWQELYKLEQKFHIDIPIQYKLEEQLLLSNLSPLLLYSTLQREKGSKNIQLKLEAIDAISELEAAGVSMNALRKNQKLTDKGCWLVTKAVMTKAPSLYSRLYHVFGENSYIDLAKHSFQKILLKHLEKLEASTGKRLYL